MYCSYCGQWYPNDYSLVTCGLCGHLIDLQEMNPAGKMRRRYRINELWNDWQCKLSLAPPHPLKEEYWLDACSYFNGCAICGSHNIAARKLLVPVKLGGKYSIYNVFPVCDSCNDRLSHIHKYRNPIDRIMALRGMTFQRLERLLAYLEAQMHDRRYERIDWDNDTITIVCTVTEDTSVKPFDGVFAQRLYQVPEKVVQVPMMESLRDGSIEGVTWRLL